jgi:hypothetical protein
MYIQGPRRVYRTPSFTELGHVAKTNLTNPDEWEARMRDKYQRITLIDNPVFLYDVNQLYDSNTTMAAFKTDLRDFLGVKADMPGTRQGR